MIAVAQIVAVFGAWALMKRLSKSDGDEDSLTGLLTGGTR